MDTLSQLLQATRVRSPLIADLRLGRDVSIGLPTLGGIPFHYVAKGECSLDTGVDRLSLRAGDFVMLSRLEHYRLETGGGTMRVDVMDFAEQDDFSIADLRTGRNRLLTRAIGDPPLETRILSAIVMPGDGRDSPLMRDLPVVTLLRDMRSMLEPWLVSAIDFMSTEMQEPVPGHSAIAERLIEVIFISVLRQWLLGTQHERGWMRGLSDPTISRALNAIHAEPGRRWTLRDLAGTAGRSRSGFAQHFQEIMGETPFAYLSRWRMHLGASAILSGKELSMAEIGASLGYSGASAFNRNFVKMFGETPAQYRRHRGNTPLGI